MQIRKFLLLSIILLSISANSFSQVTIAGGSYAGSGSGCYYKKTFWFDFTNINWNMVFSPSGQNFIFNLPDNSSFSLNIRHIGGTGAVSGMKAEALPTWGGSYIGNTNYFGITGKPALSATGINIQLQITSLVYKDPLGNILPNFDLVTADAEKTEAPEQIDFGKSGGTPWIVIDKTGTTYTLSADTAKITWGGAFVIATSNPTSVSYKIVPSCGQCRESVMLGIRGPVLVTPDNQQICNGESISLSVSGASNYSWVPATGLNTTTGSVVNANPTILTTYTITGNSASCYYSSYITVTPVNSVSLILSPASVSTCGSTSAKLTASGATTYSWYPASGLSATTGPVVFASPSSPTTYTVIGSSSGGNCSDTATILVTPAARPFLDMCGDVVICTGDSTPFCLEAANQVTFSWTPATGLNSSSISNPVARPTATTTYYLTITDKNGCTNTGSIKVTVNSRPPAPSFTVNGSVLTSSAATGYQWYYNGSIITGATQQVYTATQDGVYSVQITDPNGCSSTSGGVNILVSRLEDLKKEKLGIRCFPNPFRDKMEILYYLDSPGDVAIEVKDLLGRTIFSFSEEKSTPGKKFISLYAEQFENPGMYSLFLKTADHQSTAKIILIR